MGNEDHIIRLGDGVTISYELVTPDLATKMLDANIGNRNMILRTKERYKRAIDEKRFHFIGDPIRISDIGRTIDGQHRLMAIEETGIGVHMIVIRGIPDDYQKYIDQGSRRTAAQELVRKGLKNSGLLSAVASLVIRFERNLIFTNSKADLSNDEKVDFVLDNVSAFHFVQNAIREIGRKLPLNQTALGAVAYRVYQIIPPDGSNEEVEYDSIDGRGQLDIFRAMWFFHKLGTGSGLEDGSPIMALRNFAIRKKRLDRNVSKDQEFYYITRAWNAWRTNTELGKMQLPTAITAKHWVLR